MFAGKEMTDSASIFSVGLNGFEILFAGFTGTGLVAVGIFPVASLAAAPGKSAVVVPVESSVVLPVESSVLCSVTFASLSPGSGSGVCALAVLE
jgi:hypothetical protein